MPSKSLIEDVFAEDEDRRNRAISTIVSRRWDPEPFMNRIKRLELTTDPSGFYKLTRYETPLNTLALTYEHAGLLEFAKRVLEALTTRGSTSPATLNNLGKVTYELGNPLTAEEYFRTAYLTDMQLNPDEADMLPAARNLRGIGPEVRAIRRVRTISHLILLGSLLIITYLLGRYLQNISTPDPVNDFLTSLLQVDGFVYAFVGTFAIFVLTGIRSASARNSCLTYVLIPLLACISASTAVALWLVLFGLDSTLALIPYVLMISGLGHTFLLVFLVSMVQFTPVSNS